MNFSAVIPQGYSRDFFPVGKGIKIVGNKVLFRDYSQSDVEKVLQGIFRKADEKNNQQVTYKSIKDGERKSLSPDEVAKLQTMAGDINLADYKVYRMSAANTRIDFDNDRFTKNFLQRMADFVNAERIPLQYNHDRSQVIGKIFKAEVVSSTTNPGEWELIEYFYIDPKFIMPGQPDVKLFEAIESGILQNVSIGFQALGEITKEGERYVRVFDFIPGKTEFEPVHFETSIVSFGAQRGARIKRLNGSDEDFDITLFNLKKISITMPDMKLTVGAKSITVGAELKGENVELKGFDELLPEIKALNDKAEAEKARAEKAEKKLSDLLTPTINNIQNLQSDKGLNKSLKHKEDELKAMEPETLVALEKDLQTEYNAKHPKGQFAKLDPASNPAGEEKKSVSAYDEF